VTQIGGSTDLLGTQPPFDGRETVQLFKRRKGVNSVRPHEGVGHVLGFVAWVFDHIAEDIVDHIAWWAGQTSPEPPVTRQDTFDAMLDLTARLAEANDGVLPGSRNVKGGVTLAHAPPGAAARRLRR
jgi:hypothetical protein